jgi:hypothetical protein
MWRLALVLVIAIALAIGVTVPKLYKMAQITGQTPGATVTTRSVTEKGMDHGRQGREHYWVSWGVAAGSRSRADRDYVSPEIWTNVKVGDSIEVVHVPGDDAGYLKNGVFVEPGNFVFDYVLLAAEIITALVMVILLFVLRHRQTPELTPERVRETLTATKQTIDESLAQHRKELEQIEEQARNEQSPELKNHYLKLAEEKRKTIEEVVKLQQSLDEQLKSVEHL